MSGRIAVRHTESGCWAVLRGTYVICIYPAHMWRFAYAEARVEAIYQHLSILRIETNP